MNSRMKERLNEIEVELEAILLASGLLPTEMLQIITLSRERDYILARASACRATRMAVEALGIEVDDDPDDGNTPPIVH